MFKKFIYFNILALLFFYSLNALATENGAEIPKEVGLDTKLGTKVDLNLRFNTSSGEEKSLNQIVSGKKPLLIIPVYYECPRLCGLLLSGATGLFNQINLKMGDEFEVVTVSFNPDDTPALALKKELEFKKKINRPDHNLDYWHFLVGKKENITLLMQQIGFKYKKEEDEFAHTAAIIVLTPDGEISQYFTGIDFSAWDTRLSIIEASLGKVGSIVDHILLYCFRYDHAQGKYTWAVFNLLRVVGLASIGLVLAVIFWAKGRRISVS